jgi:hypothetical protein
VQHLPGGEIANLEAEQLVDVDEQRVCAPLTVNGRIGLVKGPTVFATVCVRVSATASDVERRLAR